MKKEIGKTKHQKNYKGICPECGGKLHEVQSPESGKIYLWCNDCYVSIDESGGYIK